MNNRLALAILNRKKRRNVLEKGFTLVELMIVIVIVGILSAVALPNFMAAKNKASAGSLIGSMSAFAKLCGANMVIEDPADIADVPATITMSADACDGSAEVTIKNTTDFTATSIGGVRCGGDDNKANGTADATCTLTINNETGSVTGAWS